MKDQEGTAIEFAEVILLTRDSVSINSTFSDKEGNFKITIAGGNYILNVRYFGRAIYNRQIIADKDIDLGELNIKAITTLSEVIVTAPAKLIEQRIDRLVFNVTNSVWSNGISATELLKNVPKIDPSSESLKIIGKSNVLAMVNGRLINLSGADLTAYLSSLRSENIERIEIITSPPAQYDAAGNSGLINIILKKNVNTGFDGSISTSFLQRSRPSVFPSSTLTYSTGAFSINANISANKGAQHSKMHNGYYYENLNREANAVKKNRFQGFYGGLNFDYKPSKKSTLGANIDLNINKTDQDYDTKVIFTDSQGKQLSTQKLPSLNDSRYNFVSVAPYYDYTIDSLGKRVKLMYNYLDKSIKDNTDFISITYLHDFEDEVDRTSAINKSNSDYNVQSFNLDIELPFKYFRIDFGGKYSAIRNSSEINYYNTTTGEPIEDNNLSNEFDYRENIQALYLTVEKPLSSKLFVKAGLRYEKTNTKGHSITLNDVFNNSFDNFFPSFYLSYKPNEDHSLSVAYTKRVDRPAFYNVNPFRTFSDYYNYSEGNPKLLPSFTHNIEFSYIFRNNLSISTYTSFVVDGMSYITIASEENQYIISTPRNFLDKKIFGFDISHNWNVFKNFSSYNSGSISYYRTTSNEPKLTIPSLDGYGYFLSSRNTYLLGSPIRGNKLYINYFHQFPRVDNLLKAKTFADFTVGGSFTFFKKALVVDVSVKDLFRQSVNNVNQQYPNFFWTSNIYNDQRSLRVTLTYKFGNSKSKSPNRPTDNSYNYRL